MSVAKTAPFLHTALAACLVLLALPAQAADYTVLQPAQPVETGHKIEVLEIFSYACPHCNALEPKLEQWSKHLPKDVELRHLPATFRADWAPYTKIYYTEEALGLTGKLHAKVYDAVHLDMLNLGDEKVLFNWVAKQGVNSKQFADAYHSFGVANKTLQSRNRVKAYGVTGVPTLVVDGKYRTSAVDAGGEQQLFAVLNRLIQKARAERAARH